MATFTNWFDSDSVFKFLRRNNHIPTLLQDNNIYCDKCRIMIANSKKECDAEKYLGEKDVVDFKEYLMFKPTMLGKTVCQQTIVGLNEKDNCRKVG